MADSRRRCRPDYPGPGSDGNTRVRHVLELRAKPGLSGVAHGIVLNASSGVWAGTFGIGTWGNTKAFSLVSIP